MTTEVERRLIRSYDCPDIIVYRCSICGELLTRTVGEIKKDQRSRYCPNCGICLRWPETVPGRDGRWEDE